MRTALLVVLLGLAAIAAGAGASQLLSPSAPESRELAVEQRLRCPQCTGIRLDVCDRVICQEMRADIRRQLAAGMSADAIVASYEQAYGPGVLMEPSGLEKVSVLLPWLAVALGLAGLVAVSLMLARPPPTLSPSAAESTPLVDEEMARWRADG